MTSYLGAKVAQVARRAEDVAGAEAALPVRRARLDEAGPLPAVPVAGLRPDPVCVSVREELYVVVVFVFFLGGWGFEISRFDRSAFLTLC